MSSPVDLPLNGVVVVLSGFPRRSETFALGELAGLAERGALQAVFAVKPGDGYPPHADAARLLPWVTQLAPGDPEAQAGHLVAALSGRRPGVIHGYFAHRPALVAQLAAQSLGVPFSFSAHAKDVRKVDPEALTARAQQAAAVITCNSDTHDVLTGLGASAHLVPHGVDLQRFTPSAARFTPPLRLLAVGRLVRKKGFHVLLRALTHLRAPWTLRLVGDGPERDGLQRQALELDLVSRVEWYGPVSHDVLPSLYRDADVVVVPSVVDEEGDRDGLPNVLLEALASARPVVATRVGAIATAIEEGRTGWLVDPDDPLGLAGCLNRVATAPHLGEAVAARGRALVEAQFDVRTCARRFVDTVVSCYA